MKQEAMLKGNRLQKTENFKFGNLVDHLGLMELISLEFKEGIQGRQIWNEIPQARQGSSVWFTKGSLINERAIVEEIGDRYRLSKSLRNRATIFQAEQHSVELCTQNVNRKT